MEDSSRPATTGTATPNFSRPLVTIKKPCPTHRLCTCPSPPARSQSQILRPSAKIAERFRRAALAYQRKNAERLVSRSQSREGSPPHAEGNDGISLSQLSPLQTNTNGPSTSSQTSNTNTPSSTRSTALSYQSPPSSADSSPETPPGTRDPPPTSNESSAAPPSINPSSTHPSTNQTGPSQQNSLATSLDPTIHGSPLHSKLAWSMAGVTVISAIFTVGSFVLQAISNGNSNKSRRSIGTNSIGNDTIVFASVFSVTCLAYFGTIWLSPYSRPRSNSSASIMIGNAAANLAKQAPSIPKPSDAPLMQYYLSLYLKKHPNGVAVQKSPGQYNMALQKIDMNWFSFFCWLVNGEPRSQQDYQGYIIDRDRAERLERIAKEQEEWLDPEFRYNEENSSYHLGPESKDLRMHDEYSILTPGPNTLGDGVRRRNSYALGQDSQSDSPFGYKDKRMMEAYE